MKRSALDWKMDPGALRIAATDATHVIWQDPSAYDPYLHGPPYLPSPTDGVNKTADVLPPSDLATLVYFLRALATIHQTSHWDSRGDTFYGDHLLFDRLYNNIVPEIDAVAERAMRDPEAAPFMLKPIAIAKGTLHATTRLVNGGDAEVAPSLRSMGAEQIFTKVLGEITESLREKKMLSRGTDNLLAGISDKHEEHAYLLWQRFRADPWKASV